VTSIHADEPGRLDGFWLCYGGAAAALRAVGKKDPKKDNKYNQIQNRERTEGMSGILSRNPACPQTKLQDKKAYNYDNSEYVLSHDSIRF
jgi:hypothetical protein